MSLWNDVIAGFAVEEVEQALQEAESVEADVTSLATAADAFKRRGEALRSTTPSNYPLMLIADGLACDLMITAGDGRERWGPLGPSWELGDGRVYPPPVSTFPDTLRSYFEGRATRTARPELRARYHDLIWLRWKEFGSATAAHTAYLEAARGADLFDATAAMTACDHLIRAVELSLDLEIEQAATIERLDQEIRRGLASEALGYACRLVHGGARLLARQPDVARALIAALSESAAAPAPTRHHERSLLESAEALARAVEDADLVRALRLRRAHSLEAEAQDRTAEGPLIELGLLEEAARLYGDVGAGKDVQRLKSNLAAASERAADSLTVVASTVSIPSEAIEEAARNLVERFDTNEALLLGAADALGLWPKLEDVQAALDKAIADHPLLFLASHTSLRTDGRYQPEPRTAERRQAAQLTRQFSWDTAIRLGVTRAVVEVLRSQGHWTANAMTSAVRAVSPSLAEACQDGFELLETGRGWAALNCLIPQLERVVRLVARKIGSDVARRAPGGGLRWASLDEMLADPGVSRALEPRLATALKWLFVDPYGPNYRNDVAHGAADPEGDWSGPAMLTALAILSVARRLKDLSA